MWLLQSCFRASPNGVALAGTDGSCADEVAAAAVACAEGSTVAFSVDGEDQSPYKAEAAEVVALVFLCRAALRLCGAWTGRFVIACDCKSAMLFEVAALCLYSLRSCSRAALCFAAGA